MNTAIVIILSATWISLSILFCWQESRNRKINFFVALLICIAITPFLGYFIIRSIGFRNPKGCKWCGNKYNEAEYCGICGKNETGEKRTFYTANALK
jgi:hypothetical protein